MEHFVSNPILAADTHQELLSLVIVGVHPILRCCDISKYLLQNSNTICRKVAEVYVFEKVYFDVVYDTLAYTWNTALDFNLQHLGSKRHPA